MDEKNLEIEDGESLEQEIKKSVNLQMFYQFLTQYIFMLDVDDGVLEYVKENDFLLEKNEKTQSVHHVIEMLKGGDLNDNILRRMVILELS
jgi:hypothetical protein